MGTKTLVTDGAVDTYIAGLAGSSSVAGDPPQWADDSDATYGRITTWSSGTSAVSARNHCSVMLKAGNYQTPTSVKVRVRLAAEQTGTPWPGAGEVGVDWAGVEIYNPFTGDTVCLTASGPDTGDVPTTPTWVEWTMAPVGGGYADLISWLAADQAKLRVWAGVKYGPTASGTDEFRYTRVYEVRVMLEGVRTEPSHCQNFPRDDRLGVGAAQNYPPPKSQQYGNRGAGSYY